MNAKTAKLLRDVTGEGMMDCKWALSKANNDLYMAAGYLRTKGVAVAFKTPAARQAWTERVAQETAEKLRKEGVFDI